MAMGRLRALVRVALGVLVYKFPVVRASGSRTVGLPLADRVDTTPLLGGGSLIESSAALFQVPPARGERRATARRSRRLNCRVCGTAGAGLLPSAPPQPRVPCRVIGGVSGTGGRLPHVADQQVGCFHGGEVAAAAELGPCVVWCGGRCRAVTAMG